MSFEAESNSELTGIPVAFPISGAKQKFLSDTRAGILGSIDGPCDSLPARSDEFQKVCIIETLFDWFYRIITPPPQKKPHTQKQKQKTTKNTEAIM